ncbi:MAG TPA: YybS family protein [Synergistales bacterium]|nr:YybS family protein [Synergistales bacterium]
MDRTRALVESSLLVALSAMLFLAGHFLPIVGMAFSLVCPAPLVVLGLRHSLGRAVLGVAVATVIAAAFTGAVGALFFCFGFGFLGIALGALGRRFGRAVDIVLYGILVSIGSKLLLMVIAIKLTGINPFGLEEAEIMPVVERIASLYSGLGMSEEALSLAKEQMRATLSLIPLIFPALLVMAATVDCFLSYIVSAAVLKRLGRETLPGLPEFSRWRFPKSIFWALIASLALHLTGAYYPSMAFLQRTALNLRLLVTALFFFQGLAVGWSFMQARGLGRFLRVALTVLVFVVSFLAQIVLVLGIIDMWFDLRSRFRGGRA